MCLAYAVRSKSSSSAVLLSSFSFSLLFCGNGSSLSKKGSVRYPTATPLEDLRLPIELLELPLHDFLFECADSRQSNVNSLLKDEDFN